MVTPSVARKEGGKDWTEEFQCVHPGLSLLASGAKYEAAM